MNIVYSVLRHELLGAAMLLIMKMTISFLWTLNTILLGRAAFEGIRMHRRTTLSRRGSLQHHKQDTSAVACITAFATFLILFMLNGPWAPPDRAFPSWFFIHLPAALLYAGLLGAMKIKFTGEHPTHAWVHKWLAYPCLAGYLVMLPIGAVMLWRL